MAQFLQIPANGVSVICTINCPEPEIVVEIRYLNWLFITIKLSRWEAKIVTSLLPQLSVLANVTQLIMCHGIRSCHLRVLLANGLVMFQLDYKFSPFATQMQVGSWCFFWVGYLFPFAFDHGWIRRILRWHISVGCLGKLKRTICPGNVRFLNQQNMQSMLINYCELSML